MSTKRKTKGVIELDDSQITEAYDFEEKCGSRIDYMMNTSGSAFEPLVKTQMLNKSVNNLKKGYRDVQKRLKGSISVLREYKSDITDTEGNYIEIVNSIKIPNMYDVNHFLQFRSSEIKKKTKRDGVSVTKGKATLINNEYDSDSAILKEGLKDISKAEVLESEYDDVSKISRTGIQDIFNDVISTQAIYDEDTALQNIDLSTLVKAGGDKIEEIDTSAMTGDKEKFEKLETESTYVDRLTELRDEFAKQKKKTKLESVALEGDYDTLDKSGSGKAEMISKFETSSSGNIEEIDASSMLSELKEASLAKKGKIDTSNLLKNN